MISNQYSYDVIWLLLNFLIIYFHYDIFIKTILQKLIYISMRTLLYFIFHYDIEFS